MVPKEFPYICGILDINECVTQNPCNINADCTNTPGSFECVCEAGYSGDGSSCTVLWHFPWISTGFNPFPK